MAVDRPYLLMAGSWCSRRPLFTHVPAAGIGWLVAGGLAYTLVSSSS